MLIVRSVSCVLPFLFSIILSHRKATDEEKADSEDEFDLLDYIRSNQAAADENGHKHKHVGVVWKNLTVTG